MGTNKQNNMTAEEIKKVLDERRGAELYLSKIEKEAQIKLDNQRDRERKKIEIEASKHQLVFAEIEKIKEKLLSQQYPPTHPIKNSVQHAVHINTCPVLLKQGLSRLGFFVDGIEYHHNYGEEKTKSGFLKEIITEIINTNQEIDRFYESSPRTKLEHRVLTQLENFFTSKQNRLDKEGSSGIYREYYPEEYMMMCLKSFEFYSLKEGYSHDFINARFSEIVIDIDGLYYEQKPVFVDVSKKNKKGFFKLKGIGCEDFPFEVDLSDKKEYKDFAKRIINTDQFLSSFKGMRFFEMFEGNRRKIITVSIPEVPLLSKDQYIQKFEDFKSIVKKEREERRERRERREREEERERREDFWKWLFK